MPDFSASTHRFSRLAATLVIAIGLAVAAHCGASAQTVLVFVNGSNNTEYKRIALSAAGATLPAGGYLVVANPGVMNIDMAALVIRSSSIRKS